MVSEIAKKVEFFCLDFFIYVLSESEFFRSLIQISYDLVTDKRFLAKFLATIFVAGAFGLSFGIVVSALAEKIL